MIQALRFKLQAEGFTLIEILIALAVVSILGSVAVSSFSKFRASNVLDSGVRQTMAILRLAQAKTLAAESDTRFGVHFEADRAILFRGAIYLPAEASNEIIIMPQAVGIGPIVLSGGGVDVLFDRLTGRTAQNGSVALSAYGESRIVTIENSGQVRAEASALAPSGTRIIDSRHVNFDLGWSIRSAATLRLTFSDPPGADIAQNIPLQDVCAGSPRASCDWSGTVDVGGSPQTLRVHTVSLTDTGTVLSVDRDLRKNTKALTVHIIDGGIAKDIASYTTGGAATPGSYGGTMIIQ